MDRLNLDKVKILAATATFATCAMFAGIACADTEVFGAVNTAIMHTTDQNRDSTLFTQNQYFPSTLGLKGSSHLNNCVILGGTSEVQFNINSSRLVNQIENTDNELNALYVRRLEAWISSGNFGKLSLGYGDAASWGITDISFAGTNQTVIGVNVANTAGGMYFYQKGTARAFATDPRVNQVFSSLNGVGEIDDYTGTRIQKNRVRYDTASWYGLSASASFGQVADRVALGNNNLLNDDGQNHKTYADVAVKYKGCFSDFLLGAGVAYAQYTRDGDTNDFNAGQLTAAGAPRVAVPAGANFRNEKVWSGSVAAEYKPWGINLAFAAGERRKIVSNLNSYKMWYGQVGKHFCFTSCGATNIAVDYLEGKNAIWNGDKGKVWGVGVSQDLNKVNSAVYVSARNYKYKNTPVQYDSVTALNAGILFKFGAML